MRLLKALSVTIALFGGSIFLAWLGHQGAIGAIAVLAIIFIATTYAFYGSFK